MESDPIGKDEVVELAQQLDTPATREVGSLVSKDTMGRECLCSPDGYC
jgi:hypothetical protein